MSNTASFSIEVPCKASPLRFMEFGPKDIHKHADKLPHILKEITVHSGDGGAGTVRDVHFTEGLPFTSFIVRTDLLDMENHESHYTLIDGGNVGKKLEKAKYYLKLVPAGAGGSWVYKLKGELTPLPGVELTAEDIDEEKNFFTLCLKSVDYYLLINPDIYA